MGVDWELCQNNSASGIKRFSEQSRERFLQSDELPRLFEALEEEPSISVRDYIYLSLFTGARKSNVLGMRWADINFNNNTWRIPMTKSGSPVTIPLSQTALETLNS